MGITRIFRFGTASSLAAMAAALVAVAAPGPSVALPQSDQVVMVPSPTGLGHGGTLACPADMMCANLPVADVNAGNLAGKDTVVLVQVCAVNTALTTQQKLDLLGFVNNGGKLLIWDSECDNPVPDYSWLPYPFTSSNPGARGAHADPDDLTIVEENPISCSVPADPCYIDAADIAVNTDGVGDMNVMITGTSQWCVDMAGRNVLGSAGPVQAYQQYGNGLIIWNGLDTDDINSNAAFARVWELNLRQSFNPASGLPCVSGSGRIDLAPVSVPANPPGTTHTLTATVFDAVGNLRANVNVTFNINGPNATTCSALTNASGVATCSYSGTNLGTDIITATALVGGQPITSNFASKSWGPIRLEPVDSTNPVGTMHTLTATVVDLSQPNPPPPLPGIAVTFEVVGAHPKTQNAVTDANGEATLSYTGVVPGLDAIRATATIGVTMYPSNFASKRWIAILLEPKTATNPVGTTHTVTASIFGADGAPLPGVEVEFEVTGANLATCLETTDAGGIATCTYTGQNEGGDVIVASFVDPTSGATITSDPSFKTWVPAPDFVTIFDCVAAPGTTAYCVVELELSAGVEVGTLQFNGVVAPNAPAPDVDSAVFFEDSPSLPPTSLKLNNGDSMVLVGWLSVFSPLLSGSTVLGLFTVPVPATAEAGDTYRLSVLNPSATLDGVAEVSLSPGPDGTLTVGESFRVCDAAPVGADQNSDGDSDDAGEFGNGTVNNADVVAIFRASLLPGELPPAGSDRFSAMNAAPEDVPPMCGGNVDVNNADVVLCFRRSLIPGLANFDRIRAAGSCVSVEIGSAATAGGGGAASMAAEYLSGLGRLVSPAPQRATSRRPRGAVIVAPTLLGGSRGELRAPVLLRRLRGLPLATLQLGLRITEGAVDDLTFEPAADVPAPDLTIREGNTLLIGWLHPIDLPRRRTVELGALSARIPQGAEGQGAYIFEVVSPSAAAEDGREVDLVGGSTRLEPGQSEPADELDRVHCDRRRMKVGEQVRCRALDDTGAPSAGRVVWFAGSTEIVSIESSGNAEVVLNATQTGRVRIYATDGTGATVRRAHVTVLSSE